MLLLDENTKVVCVIELDDRTHEWESRKKHDKYLNDALEGHHELVRFRSEKSYNVESIRKEINILY
ncbi:DUF2726 domain-containing protein [Vibrio splendidus]